MPSNTLSSLVVTAVTPAHATDIVGWGTPGWGRRYSTVGHRVVREVTMVREHAPSPRETAFDEDLLHLILDSYLSQPMTALRAVHASEHGMLVEVSPMPDPVERRERFLVGFESWAPLNADVHAAPRLILLALVRALEFTGEPMVTSAA